MENPKKLEVGDIAPICITPRSREHAAFNTEDNWEMLREFGRVTDVCESDQPGVEAFYTMEPLVEIGFNQYYENLRETQEFDDEGLVVGEWEVGIKPLAWVVAKTINKHALNAFIETHITKDMTDEEKASYVSEHAFTGMSFNDIMIRMLTESLSDTLQNWATNWSPLIDRVGGGADST